MAAITGRSSPRWSSLMVRTRSKCRCGDVGVLGAAALLLQHGTTLPTHAYTRLTCVWCCLFSVLDIHAYCRPRSASINMMVVIVND